MRAGAAANEWKRITAAVKDGKATGDLGVLPPRDRLVWATASMVRGDLPKKRALTQVLQYAAKLFKGPDAAKYLEAHGIDGELKEVQQRLQRSDVLGMLEGLVSVRGRPEVPAGALDAQTPLVGIWQQLRFVRPGPASGTGNSQGQGMISAPPMRHMSSWDSLEADDGAVADGPLAPTCMQRVLTGPMEFPVIPSLEDHVALRGRFKAVSSDDLTAAEQSLMDRAGHLLNYVLLSALARDTDEEKMAGSVEEFRAAVGQGAGASGQEKMTVGSFEGLQALL